MKNSITVDIGGKKVTLLASFANLEALENNLGFSNIFELASKAVNKDLSISQMVQIVVIASAGNADNVLKKEDVQNELSEKGINWLISIVSDFIACSFVGSGEKSGKK